VAGNPRAPALARQRLPGAGRRDRDEQGRHGRGARAARDDDVGDHSAGDWDGATGAPRYLGEPGGFVVELEDGSKVYFAGDTNVFGDMRLIRDLYAPGLAILPIGGHYTMGPREGGIWPWSSSAWAKVLPIHLRHRSRSSPARRTSFRSELAARSLGDVRVHAPEPGETITR